MILALRFAAIPSSALFPSRSLPSRSLPQLDELERQGQIDPPDLLYLSRKPLAPDRGTLERPKGAECRHRLVRPGFSYKTTAYVLWRRGAEKLTASGYTERIIPVDDFFSLLFTRHNVGPGLVCVLHVHAH